MQAIREIMDAEKLCSVIDVPEYMRFSQVEVIVFPVDPRMDAKKAVKELQQQSVANGTSNMTMEEIDAEIALCRKERAKSKI
jgi:ketosteroid isomerase-like protein